MNTIAVAVEPDRITVYRTEPVYQELELRRVGTSSTWCWVLRIGWVTVARGLVREVCVSRTPLGVHEYLTLSSRSHDTQVFT